MVQRIVAAHPTAAEGLGQALDPVPAELHARGHHQRVVAEGLTGRGPHTVGVRSESGHAFTDPGDPLGNQIRLIAAGLLKAEHAPAHQGPAWLVVVIARGLKDRHIQRRAGALQTGRHRDASGASPHDQNLVMGHGQRNPGAQSQI